MSRQKLQEEEGEQGDGEREIVEIGLSLPSYRCQHDERRKHFEHKAGVGCQRRIPERGKQQ